MKKIILLLSIVAFGTAGLAQTINDPNAEVREAKNFNAINISNAFDLYLTQGNEESVAVSASESKYREDIRVEVKGEVLVIKYDGKGKWMSGNKKLKAYVSFKQLNKIDVSGACDVYIVGDWKTENLKMEVSGASNLKGKIDAQKLMVNLSGASDITLTGTAGQLDVHASGASDFKGYDLAVEYCEAKASGASDIKITVNKELTAEASGASDVKYKGTGLIRDIKMSGSSKVSRRS